MDLNFDLQDYKTYEEEIVRVKKNIFEVKKIFEVMNDVHEAINNGIK